LGAHVQDFDFGKRIELWNEIEIIKVGYFVDGARELYSGLATMSMPATFRTQIHRSSQMLRSMKCCAVFRRQTTIGNRSKSVQILWP